MSNPETIEDSLTRAAEVGGDLTTTIYDRFFARCETARPLMAHSDQHMRGRMLEQVFELLLDASLQGPQGYLRWEIDNHVDAYGVRPEMYRPLFDAVKAAVQAAVGQQWSNAHEEAWAERIAAICLEAES